MDSKDSIENLISKNIHNKELINFIEENKITNELFSNNIYIFDRYLKSYDLCKRKENIQKCEQEVKGYRYQLLLKNNKLQLILTDCLHRINAKNQKEANANFLIRHYDENLLFLNFKDFVANDEPRNFILNYAQQLSKKNKNQTGLYLYGGTNVGKTFIFILLANKLIEKKETVCFIHWPQFVNEIKQSFRNDSDYSNKVENLKKCQYLFLDDLGSETISAWERDELLFSILDSRVSPINHKTTFINSNLNLKQLEERYSIDYNNKFEKIKVNRLIERIKKISQPINLVTKF